MRVSQIGTAEYARVASGSPQSTVYHSPGFLATMSEFLERSELVLLGASAGGDVLGALPFFIKRTSLGSVANSLPFHGSPGGCLLTPKAARSEADVRRSLLEKMLELASEEGCVSSTVVSSPLDDSDSFYSDEIHPDFTLERVAQVLGLPAEAGEAMKGFSKKCRNSIRLAERQGVSVEWETGSAALEEVFRGQERIMTALGASPKPRAFFEKLSANLRGDDDYRVYRATADDKAVGLLLTLRFNGTIEYFVPVVVPEFRRFAPMNMIVYKVILDAIGSGAKILSFGGTRPDQENLHRFKRSFGAVDRPYHYFTRLHRGISDLRSKPEAELLETFKWFFVFPFRPSPGQVAR